MTIRKKLGLIALLLPFIIPAFFTFWWFFEHVAQAESDHAEQIILSEAVDVLVAIHLKMDTEDEARLGLIRDYCALGKLAGTDCPPELWIKPRDTVE